MLVCPVNCVPGVMGAGLAKAFARRCPSLIDFHRERCASGALAPGKTVIFEGKVDQGVVMLPTKRHFRNQSTLEDVGSALKHMAKMLQFGTEIGDKHDSIAIPALGCGLGGLRWEDVRPIIIEALAPLDIDVMLYAPKEGAE